MKRIRKAAAVFALPLIICVIISACSRKNEAAGPSEKASTEKSAVRISQGSDLLSLDPETCEPAIAREGDGWLGTHANGTGPYKLAKWSKDNPCVLEVNASYWGPAPEVKNIIFDPVAVDTTRMAMLKRGDIDIMLNV